MTLTKGFYLGKYEVTQAQYEAVMTGNTNSLSATPSEWPGNAESSRGKSSWDDVQIFLTRLNAAEQAAGRLPAGWSYVLPTESEWEYACRAGTTTAYSWGQYASPPRMRITQAAESARPATSGNTRPTRGAFSTCTETFGNGRRTGTRRRTRVGAVTDPTGPASGSYRVLRGGSWNHTGRYLRSARRYDEPTPGYRYYNLGFRVGFKFTAFTP